MRKKIVASILMVAVAVMTFAGCGNKENAGGTANLEGSCEEILTKVYENAELDADFREAMGYFQTTPVTEDMEEYILGTTDVDYTDSVYSAPMMSSIAYQCVVLRLEADENVEEAKQLLLDKADPIKWVCVEAESVIVENVGDVILYIMADETTAEAIKTAFLAL